MWRMFSILWLLGSPPELAAEPAATEGSSSSPSPAASVRAQLGEQVPFAEALELCLTRIQAEVEPDRQCAGELAAELRAVDSVGLLASPKDEQVTRRRLCIVATGEQSCTPGEHDSPRSEIEARWLAAEHGRGELISLLDELGELPVDDPERHQRAIALSRCIAQRFSQFRAELRRLSEAISGRYALVVRGGVSMGAYQAGFLHYLGLYLRVHQARLDFTGAPFEVVTGSSAGGINGFLAVLEGCRSQQAAEPAQSLYYKVWINLGLTVGDRTPDPGWQITTGLYELDQVTNENLFSSRPLQQIEDNARDWIAANPPVPGCDVGLGLTATRLDPRQLRIGDSNGAKQLTVPHAVERFGFRISEENGAWRFDNLRPHEHEPRAGVSVAALDEDLQERYPELIGYGQLLEGILDLVRATGAFPLAFAPGELTLSYYGASEPERNELVKVIDGGTYDNHPIGFASRLRRWKDNGADRGAPPLALVHKRPFEFIMLEPSIVSYPEPQQRGGTRGTGALAMGLGFAGDFLVTARSAALIEAADELPWLRAPREQVSGDYLSRIPARRQPVSGEHLGHFFGFFEHDFRDFDFHVGMADARAFVEHHPVWRATAIHVAAMAEANRGLEPLHTDVVGLFELPEDQLGTADKLMMIEYALRSEFVHPGRGDPKWRAGNNFAALTLASRAFRRSSEHDLEAWVTALHEAGFRYEDLSALDVELHPHLERGRRTVGRCREPGSKAGCTADWGRVSALMRLVLGQLTDRFAVEQSRERRTKTLPEALLRTGADYALDGLFGYRHDPLTIDLAVRGLWGRAGFHAEPTLGVTGHVGGHRVGFYMGGAANFSIYRWIASSDGTLRTVSPAKLGVELTPLLLRGAAQPRRQGFAALRGALQWEVGVPVHADFFLSSEERTMRWGVGARVAVILLRHLVIGLDAKLRTDGCWGSEHHSWCSDRRQLNYPNGVRQKALDEDWLLGVTLGLRFRPLAKRVRAGSAEPASKPSAEQGPS